MDDLPLARHAGPLAAVAGALLVLTDLGRLLGGRGPGAFARDPLTLVANAGYAVSFAVLAVALVAVYLHDARATGRLGLAAFVVALVGIVEFGGNMWFDGFAGPWIAAVAPGAFAAERTTILEVGGLSGYLLFGLGWILTGVAVLRARVHPWPIGAAFLVGGVLGLQAGMAPFGAPVGLAFLALGVWLARSSRPRSPATPPRAARAR
ncbi:hypothetical protein PHK61_20400 [Actinomycetospora lutea]|uniref:hypothetical protein n=1 Tax=Actinomycetospora lutea TaxID=663604 RepID=UPI00236611DC|nr:hypothetical protein [Actinomycetospora lutea]MDD7940788.1 hypothetical protein [Actinomycetospora lutea]